MADLEKFRVPVCNGANDRVYSICFERLAKPIPPDKRQVNILAQMDRALEFVQAFKAAYYDPSFPPRLLIIGGGVAGVVAALAASQSRISVKLYEKNSALFSRQAGSDKYVYPYLYTWPLKDWKEKTFVTGSCQFERAAPVEQWTGDGYCSGLAAAVR